MSTGILNTIVSMPPFHALLSFGLVAGVLILIPGPSVLYSITQALSNGRDSALLTVVANTFGVLTQGLVVAFGVGVFLTQSSVGFTAVKVFGSAYLIYLGFTTFKSRKQKAGLVIKTNTVMSPSKVLRQGYTVGVSNPKTAIFMAVVLPQFISQNATSASIQMTIFAFEFCVVGVLSDSAWVLVAARAKEWLSSTPKRLEYLVGLGGVVIVVLGVVLLSFAPRFH